MHTIVVIVVIMIICLISTCTPLEHLNEFHFIHRTMTWHLIISILGEKNYIIIASIMKLSKERERVSEAYYTLFRQLLVTLNMIALNFKEALNWIDRRELRLEID